MKDVIITIRHQKVDVTTPTPKVGLSGKSSLFSAWGHLSLDIISQKFFPTKVEGCGSNPSLKLSEHIRKADTLLSKILKEKKLLSLKKGGDKKSAEATSSFAEGIEVRVNSSINSIIL